MLDDGATIRRDLPTGTVTFLRTDVEGSMGLARELGASWDEVNAAHLAVLRGAVTGNGGVCVRTEGDALFAAFQEASAGVRAAVDAQRTLAAHPWPGGTSVRVRMGLHSGEAHLAGDDYGGFDVNRAARVAAVGHGGQIVLSGPTRALVESSLPTGVTARSLGRLTLKDVPLPEQLFQLDVPGLRTDFPALRVADASVGNLPIRLTSFIGRDQDLVELGAMLDQARLITLTGPGGIGKTSLAVELARQHATAFPDGAWFVGLDSVEDPSQVGPAIARTLGLFDGTGGQAVDALPGFVADRSMLLILDNFEHLLEAAPIVGTLMRHSPGSRFIVASRSPLHLAGEQEYPVRPLPVEGSDGREPGPAEDGKTAAVRLFAERALAVRPGWDPAPDAPVVTEICGLLDGLPLGIELAAARMSLLPATAIRDRLAARLPLPGSGPRDAPARQRTLAGAIAWSHDLLGPVDQHVLHDLAVFQDGFDLEQAERVVCHDDADDGEPDVLERLIALADHSLIVRDVTTTGVGVLPMASGIRFTMLRTVQGFAAERLAEDPDHDAAVRHRHAETFLGLAQAAGARMQGSAQPVWLDRLGLDHGNIRAALEWAVTSGDTEIALGLVGALWRFWLLDGRLHEGAGWVDRVFAMPGADAPTPWRLQAVAAAGSIAYWQSRNEQSLRLYAEQAELAARLGDRAMAADAAFNLAAAYAVHGDDRAASSLANARHRYEELEDARGVNRVAWGEANLIQMAGGPPAARSALEACLARAVDLDDAQYVALVAATLAWVDYAMGDITSAVRWFVRSLVGSFAIRDLASSTISLPVGAVVAIEIGRPGDAIALMSAFEALTQRYGVTPPAPLLSLIFEADPLAVASGQVTPDEVAAQLRRGRQMSLADAVALIVGFSSEGPPGQ